MLSDEEKKAIDWFREDLAEEKENCGKYNDYKKQVIRRNERLLSLIEKQSKEIKELKDKNKTLKNLQNDTNGLYIGMIERKNYFERELQKLGDKIKSKIEELDIEIQCCEYADDDLEEYKQDIEKEKARLLRDKAILQSLLEKE